MIKIFGLTLLASFLIVGCNKNDNKTSENKSIEQKQEVKTQTEQTQNTVQDGEIVQITLPTIQCSMCKKNIETAVKKIDGVNDVKVNIKGKVATVNYDKSKVDINKIEGAIVMTGYQANDKPANKQSYDKLEACCKIGGHNN